MPRAPMARGFLINIENLVLWARSDRIAPGAQRTNTGSRFLLCAMRLAPCVLGANQSRVLRARNLYLERGWLP
jgi:hypothetical protein